MAKPILCLDFDGVIHSYHLGWKDGKIYGQVTRGFWEWAEKAQQHFQLVIYSSRCANPGGQAEMASWMANECKKWRERVAYYESRTPPLIDFQFASEKPKAFLQIDDRAIQFQGEWNSSELDPEHLLRFKPWNTSPDIVNMYEYPNRVDQDQGPKES
jgi:hypothetical protein